MISNAYKKVLSGNTVRNFECLKWEAADAKVQALGRFASPESALTRDGLDMCDITITEDVFVDARKRSDEFYNWSRGHVGHQGNILKGQMVKDPSGMISKASRWMLPRSALCDSVCFTDIKLYQFNAGRGFAKQRKQKFREEESEEDSQEEDSEGDGSTLDLAATVKPPALSQMEAAIDALSRELAKLRVGRASPGMLDHIMVEHYGVKTPLNRMAVVSVLDPKTLSVTPYDPNSLKELEKAIISSSLGLNPKADHQRLIVPIPPMTKEHMQAVLKVVAKSSENVKQSIRRARQKAMESIKKATAPKKDKGKSGSAGLPEEEVKRMEKEIEDLTKRFIEKSEEICKAKEKDIKAG